VRDDGSLGIPVLWRFITIFALSPQGPSRSLGYVPIGFENLMGPGPWHSKGAAPPPAPYDINLVSPPLSALSSPRGLIHLRPFPGQVDAPLGG
jgi:hypothetical protein